MPWILPILIRAWFRPAVALGHSFGRWHCTCIARALQVESLSYTRPQQHFLLSFRVSANKEKESFSFLIFYFNKSAYLPFKWSKGVEVMSFKTKFHYNLLPDLFFLFENPGISVFIFLVLLQILLDWKLFYSCIKGQC